MDRSTIVRNAFLISGSQKEVDPAFSSAIENSILRISVLRGLFDGQ
jgi:hypothetical protein